MGTCFFIILLAAFGVFAMATMIRWFEQTADAFDNREWNKLSLLVLMPFAAWLFPSRVTAGRPAPVPRHEPVRGFGGLPKGGINPPPAPRAQPAPSVPPPIPPTQPPPGTPAEFIGLPVIPPKRPRATVDPDKLARLRQKMKEQGMLGDADTDADDDGADADQG